MKKVVASIQVRLSSERLPGKVLMEINKKPLLGYLIDRLKKSKLIDQIIVATSINEENEEIILNKATSTNYDREVETRNPEKINENINNLSGGQFQRVLIARGLAQDADILLLDEAFSAVDVGAQEDIMSLISDINLDGKTILVATHDINNLEEKFDEVLCLNRHCCAYGDPSEVLTKDVIQEMYGSHFEMFKTHTPESHMKNND